MKLLLGLALLLLPARGWAQLPAEDGGAGTQRIDAETVRFSLDRPGAERVLVTGSWDAWLAHELAAEGQGIWAITLPVPTSRHLYRFVVDGLPSIDPSNEAIDVAPDGGLVSILDELALASEILTVEPAAPAAPMLGPLRLGARYRGLTSQELRESGLPPTEGLHLLDVPVAASLPGHGSLHLLFNARARGDAENADLQLRQVRADTHLSRARVRLFRNHPADPGGGAPLTIVAQRGRYAHPLGLEAQGAAGRLRFGDLRATIVQMDVDAGVLGESSRLGALALQSPLGPATIHWSGARESNRVSRFVFGDQVWSERPAQVDTLREDRSLATGWRLAASHGPKRSDSGLLALAAFTRGRAEWIPETLWRGEEAFAPSGESAVEESENHAYELALGWQRAPSSGVWRWARAAWVREETNPQAGAALTSDRVELGMALASADWDAWLQTAWRRLEGGEGANDPLLWDWIWRGQAAGVGRASWWQLPLLGLPELVELSATLRLPGEEPAPAAEARAQLGHRAPLPAPLVSPWSSRISLQAWWESAAAPALTLLQGSVEYRIRKAFFARADLLTVARDQPDLGLSSLTLVPYLAAGYSPEENLSVVLGLGVDPFTDDPVTREPVERGREDLLIDAAGYTIDADKQARGRRISRGDHALAERARISLELVYRFGEARLPILGRERR